MLCFLYNNLVPILAIIAAVIVGFRQINLMKLQNIINENTIRLGLFDKRFFIYKEIREILLQANRDAKINYPELVTFFNKHKSEISFLFDDEISDFFEKLFKRILKLNQLTETINGMPSPSSERTKLIDEKHEIFNEFDFELNNLKNRFEKYLDFKDFKK